MPNLGTRKPKKKNPSPPPPSGKIKKRRRTMSGEDTILVVGNNTLVCQDMRSINSKGMWHDSNPLHYTSPLLFFQLSIISVVSGCINLCLKPLGQSSIVSQILGGIVFGPSFLGHGKIFTAKLFPLRGNMILETIATFGLMFFFFSIGVKMDPMMMLRPRRICLVISISVFFLTLGLSFTTAILMKKYVPMTDTLGNSLPLIALAQSITAFPVIALLLTELKILNTEIGRIALGTAMFCDVLGISMTALIFAIAESKDGTFITPISGILATLALIGGIAFIVRPAILWILRHTPEGKSVEETYIIGIFVLVVISGFGSELVGQHFILGPLILGLAVPDGPPLGAALVAKLDALINGLLYPTFLAVSGLKTDVFEIQIKGLWVVGVVVLAAILVKICAVMLPAIYHNVPTREAFVLGVALNAKGINELIMYNLWKESKIISEQEFALAVISVVAITAVITPLVKCLYDPTKQYVSMLRNTIQHIKCDAELRILVCVHKQDNMPTIVNLLEVSNATVDSPIAVIAVLLVELVGRTTPMLISHHSERNLDAPTTSTTSQILNALRHYESSNQGCANVQSFTSIAHFRTMHDDICQVAVDKRATIVIVPFHKQWAIDGSVGPVNRAVRNMNLNVLDLAPCSVGILIDRGTMKGTISIRAAHTIFRVGVLYIGGADDAESLAYGARMAQHEYVNLTVIRFLLFRSENARDRKRETDFIFNIRHENSRNPRFQYIEEVVRDGVGLATLIRGMEDTFDLIIVGMHHLDSLLVSGLDQWSECPEIGVIGDMLASPDFGSTASVLVIQQQRVAGQLVGRQAQQVVSDRGQAVHDGDVETRLPRVRNHNNNTSSNATWAISMDRFDSART